MTFELIVTQLSDRDEIALAQLREDVGFGGAGGQRGKREMASVCGYHHMAVGQANTKSSKDTTKNPNL